MGRGRGLEDMDDAAAMVPDDGRCRAVFIFHKYGS